jgi:hypothetical protein
MLLVVFPKKNPGVSYEQIQAPRRGGNGIVGGNGTYSVRRGIVFDRQR